MAKGKSRENGKKGERVIAGSVLPSTGRKGKEGGKTAGGTAARPLAELKKRMEAEAARQTAPRRTMKQRVGGLFPLFGVVGIREFGLALTLVGAILFIWVWPHLWPVGVVLTIAGLATTRYGEGWMR
jgi:hypothetical protein